MTFMSRAIALILVFYSFAAWAHPLDVAYLEVQGGELSFCVNKELPAKLGFTGDSADSNAEDAFLFERFFSTARLSYGIESCLPNLISSEVNTTTKIMRVALQQCKPAGSFEIDMPFLKQIGFSYNVIGNFREADTKALFQLSSDVPTAKVSANQIYWNSFLVSGFRHIGAHPGEWVNENGKLQLPDGIDHILFLFGLLLLTVGWRSLVVVATGFSLGHMVSMVLVTLDIVKISSAIVEPVIALTIAATGLLFLLRAQKINDGRFIFIAVLLCGLAHGMGFASHFEELGVTGLGTKLAAILVFNLGIDLGQITALLVLVGLHRAFISVRVPRLYLDRAVSVFLAVVGMGLFLNRVI